MVLLVARLGAAPGADVVATAPKPSPLADAVQRGDTATIKALLKKKIDVNAQQANGATALHWAAYRRDAESTAALIRAGANINLSNNYGVTPLALAAQQGSQAVLDLLLKAGANPNDPVNFVNAGETPLMSAARSANVDAVKALARAGADVNAKETWSGQTALMWAAAEGDSAMASTLLELGADLRARSNGGTTAFQFAVRRGDMPTVQAMLAAGADVNDKRPGDFATPLLVAIINGHEDLVDLLLDKGADPNAEGGTTTLTNTGSKASEVKITLKTPSFREQLRDVGTEGDNGKTALRRRARRQLVCERRAHHCQHRPGPRHQVAAGAWRRCERPQHRHGTALERRAPSSPSGWSHCVASSGQVGRRRSDEAAAGPWRRPENQYGPQHHAADGGGRAWLR
jgi:ankyrin repeat protein